MRRWWLTPVVGLLLVAAIPPSSSGARPSVSDTRPCGREAFGVGWHLRATPSVSCRRAHRVFRAFARHGCGVSGSCAVKGYKCRWRIEGGREKVKCREGRRLIYFRSNR